MSIKIISCNNPVPYNAFIKLNSRSDRIFTCHIKFMPPKVLIVDDDRVILFLHQIIIKDSGISTSPLTFENGQEALRYLSDELQDENAIIFLDLNMPVMDGWELLDALNEPKYLDHLIVVLVTSSIDPKDREKAKKYPMVKKYIEKPLNIETCKSFMSNPAQ